MQQAIPYKTWTQSTLNNHHHNTSDLNPSTQYNQSAKGAVIDAVSENAVIVLARHGCCMSHVVKRLLNGHGVNPSVFEFKEEEENDVVKEIGMIDGGDNTRQLQFPAVFIGGRMFGGLDQVMATHISGDLIPVLKQAGALWL